MRAANKVFTQVECTPYCAGVQPEAVAYVFEAARPLAVVSLEPPCDRGHVLATPPEALRPHELQIAERLPQHGCQKAVRRASRLGRDVRPATHRETSVVLPDPPCRIHRLAPYRRH